MVHPIPTLATNTTPASAHVLSTDDFTYAWALSLPTGQTPLSAVVTIRDAIADIDVTTTIKSGATGIGSIVGAACVVTQRLHDFVDGHLYKALVVVTTTSGQEFSRSTFFDCVG